MKVYDKENVASSLQYGILIEALRKAFSSKITAPERVQHTIKNKNGSDATLLLMPAWKIGEHIGIKIVSVFPENTTNNMNAVHANYFLMNANDGKPVAAIQLLASKNDLQALGNERFLQCCCGRGKFMCLCLAHAVLL